MDIQALIKNLHPLEVKVLLAYTAKDELTASRLEKDLGYKEGHANQAFSWLTGKELAEETGRTAHTYYEITELGRSVVKIGSTIEERFVNFIKDHGAHILPKIAAALHIENKDIGSAFGQLSKDGVLAMNDEKQVVVTDKPLPKRISIVKELLKRAAASENGQLDRDSLSP